jgi:hypothetical protein
MGEKIYSNTELNEEQSRKTLRIANHGIETGMRCHGNAMKGTGKVLPSWSRSIKVIAMAKIVSNFSTFQSPQNKPSSRQIHCQESTKAICN